MSGACRSALIGKDWGNRSPKGQAMAVSDARIDDAPPYVLFPKDQVVRVDDGTPIAYLSRPGTKVPIAFINGWSCSDIVPSRISPRQIA